MIDPSNRAAPDRFADTVDYLQSLKNLQAFSGSYCARLDLVVRRVNCRVNLVDRLAIIEEFALSR
jgi:hypothetical protein